MATKSAKPAKPKAKAPASAVAPQFYITSDIAHLFGVSNEAILDRVRRRSIPAPTMRVGNRPHWKREVIDKYLQDQTKAK